MAFLTADWPPLPQWALTAASFTAELQSAAETGAEKMARPAARPSDATRKPVVSERFWDMNLSFFFPSQAQGAIRRCLLSALREGRSKSSLARRCNSTDGQTLNIASAVL